jgi:hypothetical protein
MSVPTVGPVCGPVAGPSKRAHRGQELACRPDGESGQRDDPGRTRATARCPRAWPASAGPHGDRDCHCATVARYVSLPPRVEALRRNSREIVEGARLSSRATARTDRPLAFSSAISSRSSKLRYRPVGSLNSTSGIPPASRNQREPTAGAMPTATAASSLVAPAATSDQNPFLCSRFQRRALPGDRIAGLPVALAPHPGCLPIVHLCCRGVATTS